MEFILLTGLFIGFIYATTTRGLRVIKKGWDVMNGIASGYRWTELHDKLSQHHDKDGVDENQNSVERDQGYGN